jgi:hypothetical protein
VIDGIEKKTGKKQDISAKELVDFHKRGQYEIVINRNESLRLMLSVSMELSKYFALMDWERFPCFTKNIFYHYRQSPNSRAARKLQIWILWRRYNHERSAKGFSLVSDSMSNNV